MTTMLETFSLYTSWFTYLTCLLADLLTLPEPMSGADEGADVVAATVVAVVAYVVAGRDAVNLTEVVES